VAAAQPAPRTIHIADLLRIEFFLLIAGFMILFAGAAIPDQVVTLIIMGIVMLVSVAGSFINIGFLKRLLPPIGVASVCGGLSFILTLEIWIRWDITHWTMALTLVGGVIALMGAFLELAKGAFVVRRA
jgi:energy-coupling factor transporter transmembrane protein EcfT